MRKTTEQFIEQSVSIHGTKYDYSKVDYVNTKTKVEVICPTHGSFLVRPNDHLTKKSGCPDCSGRRKKTVAEFIEQAKALHGDAYNYDKTIYAGVHTKITVTCPTHGDFIVTPKDHIVGNVGCRECGLVRSSSKRKLSTIDFIERCTLIHGDKYDYSNVDYINNKTPITIICPEHGEFVQTPTCHKDSHQGCPKCGNDRKGGLGGITESYLANNPSIAEMPAILYVVEMKHQTDNFIKVGITTRTVEQRFRTRADSTKFERTVLYSIPTTLRKAFRCEQTILEVLRDYQYWPNYLVDGKTECLKNNDTVLSYIENYLMERKDG